MNTINSIKSINSINTIMIIITCHLIKIRKFLKVQFFILMVMYLIFLASHYVKRVRIWSFLVSIFPHLDLIRKDT